MRTDHGFLVGLPEHGHIVVDDMVLDDDGLWGSDGETLLRHAARSGVLRVVCPVPEPERRRTVAGLGLSVAETWWHKDLDGVHAPRERGGAGERLDVDSAEAILVCAPPVYAPGGPVVMVRSAPSTSALRAVEQEATRRGCVVAVASAKPGIGPPPDMLEASGYTMTTEFFEGSARL
ncbi:hypothetical protein [Jiangella asiatica]|uniref:Uncharacterized protein n=1 Tax=Jiangella asiatica TaxID=2530372 RepID=A0A4R5DA45_9ACTN|nr:hypothetical protein [Jiangella asiatica]TDE09687.1 hypothetical protein E1269_13745 [Jiangella asiatica]